jgi:hypothetical protein
MPITGVYHVQYATTESTGTYPATHGYMKLTTASINLNDTTIVVDVNGIFNSEATTSNVGGSVGDSGGNLINCGSLGTNRRLIDYVAFSTVNATARYDIGQIFNILPGFIPNVEGVERYEIHTDLKIFAQLEPEGLYTDTGSTISFSTIAGAADNLENTGANQFGGDGTVSNCFLEGTKLYAHVHDKDVYINIEDLRSGDLVNTYLHGKKAIKFIGKDTLFNNPDKWNGCLKKLPKSGDMIDDLFITGAHSLLVDELSEKESDGIMAIYGTTNRKIDDKFMLNAWVSEKAEPGLAAEFFKIYHLVLEHDDDEYKKYGIWANGLLTESQCEKHFLKKTHEELL